MSSNAEIRRLVVTGATGKQGGGVVAALLDKPSQPFEIYAVTRNASSGSAQRLASKGVKIIQGEFDKPEDIFKQVDKPWGLFSVTNPIKGAKIEEQQGKAMTKAGFDAGIKHIVFSATDRGKDTDNDPTIIPHFISKFNIEKDIEEKAKASPQGTTWTFLRPVAFYENLTNDFLGKGFTSMWRINGDDRKLALVSTKDIGRVAAEAFLNASSAEYKNKAIPLAGDSISPNEAAKIFKETTGLKMPDTYSFVGHGLKWALHEQVGIMFNWFKTDDFGTDVSAVRQKYPSMKDFKTWLETESAWAKK